jgi:lysine 2,3-aminomutase
MFGIRDIDIDEMDFTGRHGPQSIPTIFLEELHRPLSMEDLRIADLEFHQELTSSDDLEDVRYRLWLLMSRREAHYHSRWCKIDDLERANAMHCVRVVKNLLSERNEVLAGCSVLGTLHAIASRLEKVPEENRAFFLDLLHILSGSRGLSGIYTEMRPKELLVDAAEAQMRSDQLDVHAFRVMRRMATYPSGLDRHLIKDRAGNRERILRALGGRREDWDDYQWHLRNVLVTLKDVEKVISLAPEETDAIALANRGKVPFGITPYYAALMDHEPWSRRDRMLRAQVIPKLDYVERIVEARKSDPRSLDFMQEHRTAPEELVTRRYPMIAIMKPYNACAQICSYCQRNWEIDGVLSPGALASPDKIDAAIKWFEEHPAVSEVLVTGGDPMVMNDALLRELLSRLAGIKHMRRIRIGTRLPVVLPMRFTGSCVDMLASFHSPPRRELCVVTHFEHATEVTPEASLVVRMLRRKGIMVYNQQVFTFENCRRFETAALRVALKQIGVDPYYTFNTKGKEETAHFRVPVARILQERKEEARMLPGMDRTDEPVFNIPGLGKNHLRAWQHHDLVMISPQGERLYEFQPWEKNISMAPTYLYRDVPIANFLQRLEEGGDDPAEYASIWYYF